MTRQEVIDKLHENMDHIKETFDVDHIALFGSFSRDEAGPESDVDILVRFMHASTFRGYFGLLEYLEDLFGRSVDLVNEKALRKELAPYVREDLIDVA